MLELNGSVSLKGDIGVVKRRKVSKSFKIQDQSFRHFHWLLFQNHTPCICHLKILIKLLKRFDNAPKFCKFWFIKFSSTLTKVVIEGLRRELSSAVSSLKGEASPTNKIDGTRRLDFPSSVRTRLIAVRWKIIIETFFQNLLF